MTKVFKRILIALLSAGWLAPLTLSFWATYDFIWNVAWPTAQGSGPPRGPFHPVMLADEFFYLSMVWAGAVVIGWSLRLTR